MHDCLSADSTPDGKPISRATAFAVYQAVRRFSGGPWRKYRAQDAVRVAALAVVQDALTEDGEQFMIRLPARRSAS